MKKRTRQILIITLGIVAIAVITVSGLFLYSLFTGDNGTPGQGDPTGARTDPFGGIIDTLFGGDPGDEEFVPPIPVLRQLTFEPTAGARVITPFTEEGGLPFVRYVARSDGNIYEIEAFERDQRRVSNTTIPSVYEALVPESNWMLYRFLSETDSIETLDATIATSTAELEDTIFYPENILSISVAPEEDRVFFLVAGNEGSSGYILDRESGEQELVFESELTEWRSEWNSPLGILLFNKPAEGIPGSAFLLSPNTGDLEELVSGNGLTASMSLSGRYLLYTIASTDSFSLTIRDLETRAESLMPFTTLIEKCTWTEFDSLYCAIPVDAEGGSYPDGWYRGDLRTSDVLVLYLPESDTELFVYDLTTDGNTFDVDQIYVDPDELYLVFRNKVDQVLWGLSLIDVL